MREALLKLRGEGMVQLEPHRGHIVLPLTQQDIDDIFWLQATIAREVAAAATEHITDSEIDQLDRLNDALETAIGSGDAETIAGLEFAFHRVFNQASGRIDGLGSCFMPRGICRCWCTRPIPYGARPRSTITAN